MQRKLYDLLWMANNLPIEYPFYCPKCGHKEIITMSMKEYVGEGHMCPECGEEMKREIESMVCRSIDKTGGFYRSFN